MNKIYAGIGGRNTPSNILQSMMSISEDLAKKNYILRSGGADGADSAFEQGVNLHEFSNGIINKSLREIYLPWKNFNNNQSDLYLPWNVDKKFLDIIEKVNPKLLSCSHSVISLHARNCQQILGENLDIPCGFVLCWTDRDRTWFGGTMFAIRLAELNHIPVINMIDENWKEKLDNIIGDINADDRLEDISKVEYREEMSDCSDQLSIDELSNCCKINSNTICSNNFFISIL